MWRSYPPPLPRLIFALTDEGGVRRRLRWSRAAAVTDESDAIGFGKKRNEEEAESGDGDGAFTL